MRRALLAPCLVILAAESQACETCRPRVRSAVYRPTFTRDLGLLLAPLGGVALCAAFAWRRR